MAPQTQSRSSAVSCTPHLASSRLAAVSGSVLAILSSASTTSSLRVRPSAVALLARNLAGLSATSCTAAEASGATISTALRAARVRLASIDRRALRHTSSSLIFLAAYKRSAASVQPSSASRCAYQLRRRSSATVLSLATVVPRSWSTSSA